MPKKPKAAKQTGVQQAWTLPGRVILALGVDGQLRRWDARTGESLGTLPAAGPVLLGSLIGDAFLCITDTRHLIAYDARRAAPLWIRPLEAIEADLTPERIERLGEQHLAVIAYHDRGDRSVHVLGPFPGLPLAGGSDGVEYGSPGCEYAVVGDGVHTMASRQPEAIEPLRGGRKRRFSVAAEKRRELDKMDHRIWVAGDRLITIGEDAMWYVESSKRSHRGIFAWDAVGRSFVGRVDVLDEIEGAEYEYPEPGDLDDPVVQGMLGFPSGRILSWGLEQLHLWSARTLKMQRLLPLHWPNGAFIAGGRQLVIWDRYDKAIYSWSLQPTKAGARRRDTPLRIDLSAYGLSGACHLAGDHLVSWSARHLEMHVWNFVTGRRVRTLRK